jgi:hypothetical protein
LPRSKVVWVVAEEGEELHVRGDLYVLWDLESKQATLFKTVETYVEPSQGIIDKWHMGERPYCMDSDTHMFHMLEEVECRIVENEEEMQELFDSVQSL